MKILNLEQHSRSQILSELYNFQEEIKMIKETDNRYRMERHQINGDKKVLFNTKAFTSSFIPTDFSELEQLILSENLIQVKFFQDSINLIFKLKVSEEKLNLLNDVPGVGKLMSPVCNLKVSLIGALKTSLRLTQSNCLNQLPFAWTSMSVLENKIKVTHRNKDFNSFLQLDFSSMENKIEEQISFLLKIQQEQIKIPEAVEIFNKLKYNSKIWDLYVGRDMPNALPGTKLGVLNTVTFFETHQRKFKSTEALHKHLIDGKGANNIKKCVELLSN
jgi:hypothetical protein